LNGGGQIKPKDLGLPSHELLENLQNIQSQSLELISPENFALMSLYSDLDQEKIPEMIKTYFSAIKTETSLGNLKW